MVGKKNKKEGAVGNEDGNKNMEGNEVTSAGPPDGGGSKEADGGGGKGADGGGGNRADSKGSKKADGKGSKEADGKGSKEAEGKGSKGADGKGSKRVDGKERKEADNKGRKEANVGSGRGGDGGVGRGHRPREESEGVSDKSQNSSRFNSKEFNESNQQGSRYTERQKPYDSQQATRHYQQGRDKGPGQNSGVDYKKHVEKQWQPDARENFVSTDQQGPNRKRSAPVNLNSSHSPGVIEQLQCSLKENRVLGKPSLQDVIEKSIEFWDEFPSNTARLHVLQQGGVPYSKLETFVHSVYPIVHHSCLNLMNDFLEFKRAKGSSVEKALYKNMNLLSFMDRLLKQRPLAFLGSNDRYLLPDLKSGAEGFEAIGTDREQPPLLLEKFLSYDEIRIAALVSLSSWSVFVNNGRRKNYGQADRAGTFQPEGVIVGQVGARLKREGVMDYLDCVVMRTENVAKNGFGGNNQWHVNSVFDKLWGKPLPTFEEANRAFLAQRDGKPIAGEFEIMPIGRELFFNVTVYKKRILIPAEILLCEANTRAREAGKKAYVHVVGLGLGVWRASNKQEELFVEAWGDALLNVTNTDHIAHVDFSYIDSYAVHGVKDGEKFPNTNITIHFSKRDLHDKVPDDCILVCSYAWDGNSLPGNEFWMGKMCSTGDSAAACSSCVAEIHNHLFNPLVSGDNLRVASREGYLLSWQDYLGQCSGASPKPAASAARRHPPVVAPTSGSVSSSSPPAVQPGPKPDFFDNPDVQSNQQSSPINAQVPLSVNVNSPRFPSQPSQGASLAEPMESEPMESEPMESDARTSVSDSIVLETSLSTSVKSDTNVSTPPAPVCKKPRQSAEAFEDAAAEVVEDKKLEPEVPKEIPHGTIPGLMITNPAYKAPRKQGGKNKGQKIQGENSQDAGSKNQSQGRQNSAGGKNSKESANPSKGKGNSGGGGGDGGGGKPKVKGGVKDAKKSKPTNSTSDGGWQQTGGNKMKRNK